MRRRLLGALAKAGHVPGCEQVSGLRLDTVDDINPALP